MGRTQRGGPAGDQDEVRAGVYHIPICESAFGDGSPSSSRDSVDVTRDERRHSRFQSWLACPVRADGCAVMRSRRRIHRAFAAASPIQRF